MSKTLDKLIEKFKNLEKEIISILSVGSLDVDEKQNKTIVKKEIKEYIKKLNKAKKLFDEYEDLAKQISDLTVDEDDSAVLSKTIFEEDIFGKKEEKIKDINELKNEKQKSKNKSKIKNKQKQSVKEF